MWLRGMVEEATGGLVLPHVGDYDAGPDGTSPPSPKLPLQQDLLRSERHFVGCASVVR